MTDGDFKFRFGEGELLARVEEYVRKTYGQHYAAGNHKIQAIEFIMDSCEGGIDFLRGNALKYIARWGKKDGRNEKDLFKAIHYIILMHHYSQRDENETISDDN